MVAFNVPINGRSKGGVGQTRTLCINGASLEGHLSIDYKSFWRLYSINTLLDWSTCEKHRFELLVHLIAWVRSKSYGQHCRVSRITSGCGGVCVNRTGRLQVEISEGQEFVVLSGIYRIRFPCSTVCLVPVLSISHDNDSGSEIDKRII